MTVMIGIDGSVMAEDQAKISVLDRGFLYGDSVYEVIRTYGGAPFALAEHLERLQRSADLLQIELPVTPALLAEEIGAVLAAAGNRESYVRIIVTRGSGPIGLDMNLAIQPRRVLIVTELKELPREIYEQGCRVHLVAAGRSSEGAVPKGAKSGNYLANIMALSAAHKQGAHEAILLDAGGRVMEGASSNIFLVSGGEISTPPLSAGILEGITRQKVFALAREAGLPLRQRELIPADLWRADEVFLTSTLREVLPVTSVDGAPVGDGTPGAITRMIHSLYQAAAHAPAAV